MIRSDGIVSFITSVIVYIYIIRPISWITLAKTSFNISCTNKLLWFIFWLLFNSSVLKIAKDYFFIWFFTCLIGTHFYWAVHRIIILFDNRSSSLIQLAFPSKNTGFFNKLPIVLMTLSAFGGRLSVNLE